jgi:hypothetical protein
MAPMARPLTTIWESMNDPYARQLRMRRANELPDVSLDTRTQPTVTKEASIRNVEIGQDFPPAAATKYVAIIGVSPPMMFASWYPSDTPV